MTRATHQEVAAAPVADSRSRLLAIVVGVLIFVFGILAIVGWTPWPVVGAAFTAWLLAVSSRVGYVIAASVSTLVIFGALLGGLLASAAIWADILPTIGVLFIVVGGVGCVLLARTPLGRLRRPAATWRDLGASCVGLVVWIVALLLSARLSLGERLGWVMRNDSMNNLVFAHAILRAHGILLGGDQNPTPLPAGMIALGIVSGRASMSPEVSLQHDLIGMGLTWAALIGLVTVLMGLTATVIVRSVVGSGVASHLAGLAGSLIVLSWFVTGYPIEYGFLNLDLVIPVLLTSLLMTLAADRLPWLSASSLLVAATLMLSAWSPLVVVPLALLLLTVIRKYRALRASSLFGLVVMALAALQLLAYALLGALPSYVAQSSALAGNGGIYNQNYAIVFVTGAVVIVVGFFVFRHDRPKFAAVTTVVAACWVGLGILLFLNRNNPTPWTYYPIKLAFFSTVVFIIIALGLAVAFLAQRATHKVLLRVGAVVIALIVVGVVVVTPRVDVGLTRLNPLVRIVASHPGEELVRQGKMVQVLARTSAPAVLWDSHLHYESQADLWLLQLRADTLSGTSKLRLAAYNQLVDRSTHSLCEIVKLVGPSTVIYTADGALKGKLAKACPNVRARFAPVPTATG